MQKALSEEQKESILTTAIEEFANHGFEGANINTIAEKAKVSVGTIYKYYEDKEAFFNACVTHSLSYLDDMFYQAGETGGSSLMDVLKALISQVQAGAKEHPEYYKLYLQLTAMSEPLLSKETVAQVEGTSSRIYTSLFQQAKMNGTVDDDFDINLFSFFFDNMIMMLHFAYCSDYYKERFKVFCGKEIIDQDEYVCQEMMKFLAKAFGYKNEDVDEAVRE